MLLYTFFVVNLTTMVFIVAVYAFAHRFLREKLYLGLALGWLLNTVYLLTEIPGVTVASGQIIVVSSYERFRDGLMSVTLGMASALIFHLSAKLSSQRDVRSVAVLRPLAFSAVPLLVLVAGLLGESQFSGALNEAAVFAVLTLPAVLYSFMVLMLIAVRLSYPFPEEQFGYASRLLSSSWGGYALLQLAYPLKLFSDLSLFINAVYVLALGMKLLGIVGLLTVLRKYYEYAQDQARHASVLADLGNLAAGLHHDIATPLASVDSELDRLSSERSNDKVVVRFLERVNLPMRAIYAALQLVDLARLDLEAAARDVRPASARDIVGRAVNLFRGQFTEAKLRVFVPGDTALFARAHAEMLAQAFVNIIKNAHEAGASRLVVNISRLTDSSPPKVRFVFQNDGPPLSAEEIKNCLKPGWSTKRQYAGRANVGMGLYMTRKYVAIHQGDFEIRNREGDKGVEVIVDVPGARPRHHGET